MKTLFHITSLPLKLLLNIILYYLNLLRIKSNVNPKFELNDLICFISISLSLNTLLKIFLKLKKDDDIAFNKYYLTMDFTRLRLFLLKVMLPI